MTANERRLLVLLVATAALSAAAISFYAGWERLTTAESSISEYEKAIGKHAAELVDSASAEARIAELRDAIASLPKNTDLGFADFAGEVRSLLAEQGIEPLRYQVIGSGAAEFLELSLQCETEAFFRFLSKASSPALGWSFPLLVVRPSAPSGFAEITVRAGHAR